MYGSPSDTPRPRTRSPSRTRFTDSVADAVYGRRRGPGCGPGLRFAVADAVRGNPTPAFGSAPQPRSAHFPQGPHFRNRESIALEENGLGGLRLRPRFGH